MVGAYSRCGPPPPPELLDLAAIDPSDSNDSCFLSGAGHCIRPSRKQTPSSTATRTPLVSLHTLRESIQVILSTHVFRLTVANACTFSKTDPSSIDCANIDRESSDVPPIEPSDSHDSCFSSRARWARDGFRFASEQHCKDLLTNQRPVDFTAESAGESGCQATPLWSALRRPLSSLA